MRATNVELLEPRRWQKMYKGTRHAITCEQLGLAPDRHTKEASYQAANDWWLGKLAALQAATLAAEPEVRHLARAAVRAGQEERHGGGL